MIDIGQHASTCKPNTNYNFTSHFDWFGIHLPRPAQGQYWMGTNPPDLSKHIIHQVFTCISRSIEVPRYGELFSYLFTKSSSVNSKIGNKTLALG